MESISGVVNELLEADNPVAKEWMLFWCACGYMTGARRAEFLEKINLCLIHSNKYN